MQQKAFGGTLNGLWAWMKYGAIFKKEDGQWKIWHLHTYSIFMCPYDKCWTEVEPYGLKKEIPPEMLEMMKKEMDSLRLHPLWTRSDRLPRMFTTTPWFWKPSADRTSGIPPACPAPI